MYGVVGFGVVSSWGVSSRGVVLPGGVGVPIYIPSRARGIVWVYL